MTIKTQHNNNNNNENTTLSMIKTMEHDTEYNVIPYNDRQDYDTECRMSLSWVSLGRTGEKLGTLS
jgi:hypothetical protein